LVGNNQRPAEIPPAAEPAGQRHEMLEGGRVNQKRRTMQALMDAAVELASTGQVPTFQQVAQKASVSRATAYRYFSSIEALTHQGYFDRAVAPLLQERPASDDPVAAIGHAALQVNQVLLDNETGTHVVELSSMQVWLAAAPDGKPPRPGRRMSFIDPILQSTAPTLNDAQRSRLRIALSMLMGTEAVLAMRDVGGADVATALATSQWAAQALMRQALAEARPPAAADQPSDQPAKKSPPLKLQPRTKR
jgi:AcrR family transcriptional regulator